MLLLSWSFSAPVVYFLTFSTIGGGYGFFKSSWLAESLNTTPFEASGNFEVLLVCFTLDFVSLLGDWKIIMDSPDALMFEELGIMDDWFVWPKGRDA